MTDDHRFDHDAKVIQPPKVFEVVWHRVADRMPPPHRIYLVRREGVGEFHATPCYGLHSPWWVPRNGFTKEESEPINMEQEDEWQDL